MRNYGATALRSGSGAALVLPLWSSKANAQVDHHIENEDGNKGDEWPCASSIAGSRWDGD